MRIPVIFPPSQPKRPRSTDSSMRRWWPRPRREVSSRGIKVPVLKLGTLLLATDLDYGHRAFHLLFLKSPLFCIRPTLPTTLCVELKEAQKRKKQLEDRCKLEESIGTAAQIWNLEILPNWSTT